MRTTARASSIGASASRASPAASPPNLVQQLAPRLPSKGLPAGLSTRPGRGHRGGIRAYTPVDDPRKRRRRRRARTSLEELRRRTRQLATRTGGRAAAADEEDNEADDEDKRARPSIELSKSLEERGALVEYSDPHIAETPRVRKHDLKMTSIELTPANIKAFDCVLVATNHAAFDYGTVAANAKLIVDTRDAMRAFHDELGDRLVLA